MQSSIVECYPTEEKILILPQMFIQNSTHQHIYKKTTLMPLLLMESDGVTNVLAEIAACCAHRRHILCKAVAVAVADEIARDARVYAVVDHCASLFLHSARRYSKSKAFGSKLE